MSAMAPQITGVTIVYSIICSGADQEKHPSSVSLAFVRGFHRWPLNSPHKGPATRKMFPFDDVIMWPWLDKRCHGTRIVALTLADTVTCPYCGGSFTCNIFHDKHDWVTLSSNTDDPHNIWMVVFRQDAYFPKQCFPRVFWQGLSTYFHRHLYCFIVCTPKDISKQALNMKLSLLTPHQSFSLLFQLIVFLCYLDHRKGNLSYIRPKYTIFNSSKCVSKCHLQD